MKNLVLVFGFFWALSLAHADSEFLPDPGTTGASLVHCKAWKGGDVLAAEVEKPLDQGGGAYLVGTSGGISFDLTVSLNSEKGVTTAILNVTDQMTGLGSRNRGSLLKDEPFEVTILKNGGGISGEVELSKFLVSCVLK